MNRKGFTLMEVLAVLLILALVTMFALPVIRQVRSVAQHHQARSAALKIVAAVRAYAKDAHLGSTVLNAEHSIDGTNLNINVTCGQFTNGVPPSWASVNGGSASASPAFSLERLFACDYLSVKDFTGLPYTFSLKSGYPNGAVLKVTGTSKAGRYEGKYFYVYKDGSLADVEGVD